MFISPLLRFLTEATGVDLPKDRVIDSVNLLPHLKGEVATAPHESLYWRFGEQHAIRKGSYKLMKLRNGEEHLFDLKQDIGEKQDLLGERAAIAADLRAEFEKWNSQLAKLLWVRVGPDARDRDSSATGPGVFKPRSGNRVKSVSVVTALLQRMKWDQW